MSANLGLARLNGRCAEGFAPIQHPRFCLCGAQRSATDDWSVFLVAVDRAKRSDGTVSNNDLRPHIQAIPSKTRGRMYSRAINEGVLELLRNRREPSTDRVGKNTDKDAKFYAVHRAA